MSTTEATKLVLDHEVKITADENLPVEDAESARAISLASSGTSVAASIFDYRQENGRTYHAYKDGKYKLPNDETENDRLDLQHNLFLLTFDDKLGNAPPNDRNSGFEARRVLDVGTGTGIWAVDFADEHPDAEVLGFDLSAAFPTSMPPNVRFEVDDLDEPWTYPEKFDYIHSRMMNGCVPDWDVYAKKCFDNLNPGGWVEFNETSLMLKSDDGTLKGDSMIVKIARLFGEASVKFGRVARDMTDIKDILTRAGFVDVRVMQFKWPTNTWPKEPRHKEIGLWSHENIVTGWEGLALTILTRAHGWTREQVMVANGLCREEFGDKRIHAYYPIYSAYGRKPTEAEA